MVNFEVYKNWYVTECWTAFSQFAKFRKDILREVKDEYITKNKALKNVKRKSESKKKSKLTKHQASMSPLVCKKLKVDESVEWFDSLDDSYSEAFLRNSLQKTWEIIIKTDRGGFKRKKQIKQPDELQEFSCQAYMEVPTKRTAVSWGVSDGFQTNMRTEQKDIHTQAILWETTATSTQTLSDSRSCGADVWMQFPPDNETSQFSCGVPIWKESSVDVEIKMEPVSFKDVGV